MLYNTVVEIATLPSREPSTKVGNDCLTMPSDGLYAPCCRFGDFIYCKHCAWTILRLLTSSISKQSGGTDD